MAKPDRKLVIVQAAALGYDFLRENHGLTWEGMEFRPLAPIFPALTCPVQASVRTGEFPANHGVIANGFFARDLRRPLFWEQSAALVQGRRIWENPTSRGKRVALLFWQQSLGEPVDVVLSPAPIHKHHGGMIQDCYSMPRDLYARLIKAIGRPFKLGGYWGPLASSASSQWIAEATAWLLGDEKLAPDVCLTYLPALDYDLQRHGPNHKRGRKALSDLMSQLATIRDAAQKFGYAFLVFGDYAIAACDHVIYPNLALRKAGLFLLRSVKGALYPDFHASRAFALVDHQIAHIYVKNAEDLNEVRAVIEGVEGVDLVLDHKAQGAAHIGHDRAGELVAVSRAGAWMAYSWWETVSEAPDYARHVDIHNKPGYDPAELFFGWPPGSVSLNAHRIRGSHGRTGPGCETCWAASNFDENPSTQVELAKSIERWLSAKD